MAAVAGEQILTLTQFLIHGVSFDRSAGAFDPVLAVCQYKDRPAVLLADPSRNDSGKALMAFRQIHDQYLSVCKPFLFDEPDCLLHAARCHLLTALVQIL